MEHFFKSDHNSHDPLLMIGDCCLICLRIVLSDPEELTLKKHVALTTIMDLIREENVNFLDIVSNDSSFIFQIADLIFINTQNSSIAVEVLIGLLNILNNNELNITIINNFIENEISAPENNFNNHVIVFMYELLHLTPYILPSIILKSDTLILKFLIIRLNSCQYKDKVLLIKILCFIYSKNIFSYDKNSSMHNDIINAIINIIKIAPEKELIYNSLMLVQILCKGNALRFAFNNFQFLENIYLIFKKCLLIHDLPIQRLVAQCLLDILIKFDHQNFTAFFQNSSILEFVFETLLIPDLILVERLYNCIFHISQYDIFFKNNLTVYGLESLQKSTCFAHDSKHWALMGRGLELIAVFLEKSDDIILSSTLFHSLVELLHKSFQCDHPNVFVHAIRILSDILKDYLPKPFPIQQLQTLLSECFEIIQIQLLTNQGKTKTTIRLKKHGQDRCCIEAKLIHYGLEVVNACVRLHDLYVNNPQFQEMAYSVTKGANTVDEELPFFLYTSLDCLDRLIIPHVMLYGLELCGDKTLSFLFQILGSIKSISPFEKLVAKLISSGFINFIWDVRSVMAAGQAENAIKLSSLFLKDVIICLLSNDERPLIAPIVEDGIDKWPNNIATNLNNLNYEITSSEITFLYLCHHCLCFQNPLVDSERLLPFLLRLILNGTNSSEISLKPIALLFSEAVDSCINPAVEFELTESLKKASAVLRKEILECPDPKVVFTPRRSLIQWCLWVDNLASEAVLSRVWLDEWLTLLAAKKDNLPDLKMLQDTLCSQAIGRDVFKSYFIGDNESIEKALVILNSGREPKIEILAWANEVLPEILHKKLLLSTEEPSQMACRLLEVLNDVRAKLDTMEIVEDLELKLIYQVCKWTSTALLPLSLVYLRRAFLEVNRSALLMVTHNKNLIQLLQDCVNKEIEPHFKVVLSFVAFIQDQQIRNSIQINTSILFKKSIIMKGIKSFDSEILKASLEILEQSLNMKKDNNLMVAFRPGLNDEDFREIFYSLMNVLCKSSGPQVEQTSVGVLESMLGLLSRQGSELVYQGLAGDPWWRILLQERLGTEEVDDTTWKLALLCARDNPFLPPALVQLAESQDPRGTQLARLLSQGPLADQLDPSHRLKPICPEDPTSSLNPSGSN